MFIVELILLAAEILFLVYLVRKQKEIAKKQSRVEFERKSVKNLKEILEGDFIWELEERKNLILKEFSDQLYSYHLSRGNISAIPK